MGSNYNWAFNYVNTPIKNIVEIGSRDLIDSIELSNHFNAKVYAFEPDPDCVELCLKNLSANTTFQPIQLISKALSSVNGEQLFYVYSQGNSSLYKHKSEDLMQSLKITTYRFDSLDLDTPDLVCMDAQSGEAAILEGFGEILRDVKYLIFETAFYSMYEQENNFDYIAKYLKKNGFAFVATNHSSKGKLKFFVMRARGIFYNVRKLGFRGFRAYSGFFDVLFINKYK
jgi:FkbM family methyltransferase